MISNSTRYRQTIEIGRQARLSSEIARAQTEISMQKRILAPSDAPVDAARVSQIGKQQGREAAFLRNAQLAAATASRADTALAGVQSILDRAKELMLTATNSTASAEDRALISIELKSIAEEVRAIAETRDLRSGYLFSDAEPIAIPVSDGISVSPVDSRERVFDEIETGSGTLALDAIIAQAAEAIKIGDDATRSAAGRASLDALDAGMEHIATARAEQGLRAARVDAIMERLDDSGLRLKEERSTLEDVDIPDAIARIEAKKLSLDAAQAIYAKLNQSSLFDLLR